MKKTLLAAALLAGFAGAAQAQSTQVTLYGIIDTGLVYQDIDDANSTFKMGNGIQSGSRWGLRGTEDLGGGLQAVFQLESGFSSDNGRSGQSSDGKTPRLFGRQATIGLQGASWGRLDFGRQTNISSKYLSIADPFGAGFGAGTGFGGNYGNSFGFADTARYDDLVLYQTPVIAGFQFGVGYSFSVDDVGGPTSSATTDNKRGITTGLKYANGPLAIALTYEQVSQPHNVSESLNDAKAQAYSIGLAYDFEVVKVHAAFGRTNDVNANGSGNWLTNAPLKDLESNSYLIGLTVPVGSATNILFSYQVVDPDYDDVVAADAAQRAEYDAKEAQKAFSLGATYALSKRTNLYAYGAFAQNVGYVDGRDGKLFAAGIRHQF